jgi:3-dehydroquinate synthase
MVVLHVFDSITIKSHKGPYTVSFDTNFSLNHLLLVLDESHFIIDAKVAKLYSSQLSNILARPNTIIIEAREDNKSLERIVPIFEKLILNKVRREHNLVAIGGGIIQDITCFIASTLLRGLPWYFIPTTLLAQADSCIGSKSSINLNNAKNIIGTFNPPRRINICTEFLDTLEQKDIHSGIGEIIKVHAIDGVETFDKLSIEFRNLYSNHNTLLRYINTALLIKKRYIEEDEFDKDIRNIFNYGHSFGHAIESATNYLIPHGIAVTIGMEMANYVSLERGLLPQFHFDRMKEILRINYLDYASVEINLDVMIDALMKDKKNTSTRLGLILPIGPNAEIKRVDVIPDSEFYGQCMRFLSGLKR